MVTGIQQETSHWGVGRLHDRTWRNDYGGGKHSIWREKWCLKGGKVRYMKSYLQQYNKPQCTLYIYKVSFAEEDWYSGDKWGRWRYWWKELDNGIEITYALSPIVNNF